MIFLKFYELIDELWTLEKDTYFLSELSLTFGVQRVMKDANSLKHT